MNELVGQNDYGSTVLRCDPDADAKLRPASFLRKPARTMLCSCRFLSASPP